MARLIPQKQIEEVNIFKDNISVKKSVFISGSLLVSQSIDIGSDLTTPQRITGSVQITGSLEIDGPLSFANAEDRLDATASFADESVDSQRFGGILAREFGESDATLYVSSTNGSDDNDGRTPQFPLRTIKQAAKIATDGDDGRYGLPTGSLFTGFAIKVDTGTYLEDNPIELPKNTTVWGSGLRVTKVLAKNENEDLFWVNSGNYLSEMTFGNLRVFPSVDVSEKGFAVAFAPNAFITTSPYVQNCSMISNQENSFLEAYEEIPAGGGGLNVDGNRIHPDSPLASMVLDAYTQIAPNGVGCQVVGRGFIQLVSFFTNFSAYSVKVIDGGQAVLLNSNTSFGDFGMYASGSRFITGSGGNADAFFNVQDNYSIIVDTIKNGLSSIPDLVPNTFEGRRLTDLIEVPQYFVSEDSTTDVAERVKSDFRLVSSIVEDGITNVPKLLAKSGKGGYGPTSLYNVSGDTQYTNVATASNDDITFIDTNFDITLDIINRGNVATASYVQIDNVSSSIKTTDIEQYSTFAVQSDTSQRIVDRFNTVIDIIENGLTFSPIVSSSTMAGYKFTDTPIYETDVTSSLETIQSVSASFSIVYDILANGTGSLPTTILSSSIENPSVDVQNAYTLLVENIPFIQDETIAYLSSAWSEHSYNQETCKRDVGFIISSSAHDLLFGGNEESIRSGVFYYQFPSNATTTEKDPTLTGVKYASELAINILDGKVFAEAPTELDNAYDVIYRNKNFVREETIAYLSSSWSTFDYNEDKCKRDIGYILDAVATDIHYGGNERSVTAGEFYYQYPSLAIVDNRTVGQLQQTLDGVKYAKRITEKLVNNDTFVTAPASVLNAVNLIKENRSLIQSETITYIDTQYPNFSYDRVKCKRDVGYIIDNVLTDLLYGGNERSELAGLYYFLYPSIANTTQLEETLEAIRYTKEFTKAVAQSIVLETPQVILNVDGNIRATSFIPTTGSIDATDSEVTIVSQSFGIIEDIIRYGTDSVLSSIAGNSEEYSWNLENPLNVSGITQITSSVAANDDTTTLVTSSFDTVIKIIQSGSSITTEETIGTDSKGNPISTVGIPKNSYGDNLITTTIGTTIPSDITLVKNTEAGIKFGNDSQITSSVTIDSVNINKVSSSFSIVSDIIKYGISGSLGVSGSTDASTYFEVVTLEDGSFNINKTQLQKFDDVDGRVLGENTGSFEDSVKDPTLTLKRGDLYTFSINSLSNVNAIQIETEPFFITTQRSTDSKYRYNNGITNNGSTFGTITFIVPFDAPDRLFYVNGNDVNASGIINIVDTLPLSDTQRYVEIPSLGEFEVTTNNVDGIKVSDIVQYTSSITASISESIEVSSSFATVIDILSNGVGNIPTITKNSSGNIKKTIFTQYTSSVDSTNGIINTITSSFDNVINIIRNGTDSIPTLVENTTDLIKVSSISQITSSLSGSSVEVSNVSSSFAIVLDILGSGTGSLPIEISNTNSNIKFHPAEQFTGSLSGSLEDISFVSSSISIVSSIITYGSGSYLTASNYGVISNNPSTLAAYEIIKENISFIQNETIAYLSSSWSTASYNEQSCSRDVGLIVSGAAEDLLYGTVSASIVNGKFYLEYPSEAETSQLNQTLDGIEYASKLTQNLIQNIEFVTASTEVSASYNLIRNNRDFIKEETISYLSSSWSTFDYNEVTCKRDVGHIIDAVSTDLLYGGNERSVNAGVFYYQYPSEATSSQLDQTKDGINYARRLVENIVDGNQFAIAPFSRTNGYDLLFNNKEFIQNEVTEYISSSWSDFEYNDVTCRRDVGYIVDAVVTDLLYGGNERSSKAGEFYYLYPSTATTSQLDPTVDGVKYAKNLSIELLQNNVFVTASQQTVEVSNLISENRSLIQSEVISYISSSWSDFEYNEASCSRDTGYIVDAIVTDFYYGGNERSSNAGEFYYLYPSSATVSGSESPNVDAQLYPTIDGVKYAQRLTNKLINNVTLVTASIERQTVHSLMVDNRGLIQSEVISFMSSSWSNFEYDDIKCRRDVGYIVDAVATDVLYGGNERSVTAGEFYYLFPSEATTIQSDQTITGITHAAGLADKIIQNTLLVNASSEKISAYNTMLDNKALIQFNVTEFIDQTYPYFTYDRVKCRRDVGYIIDAVATDLLWGGNERSIVAGDYYYRYPSKTTTLELTETTDAIKYANLLVDKLITNVNLVVPSITSNTNSNIRFNDTEQYSGSLSISGSNLTDISSSFSVVVDTIQNGLTSLPTEVKNTSDLIKVTNATQTTSSLSGSDTQIGIISASIDMINDIIRLGSDNIPFAIAKHFQTSELDNPQNITTGSYIQIAGGNTADSEYNNGSIVSLTGDGSDFFKKEATVNGVRIVVAGDVGGQTAVPDAFTEKVARMFELFTDPSGSGINETFQRNLIKTLSGDTGTYHAGLPTIQRVARGAGSDYTPNFLDDAGILYWNLTNLFDTTVQNDMVWYLNSTGDISGSGDNDAQEVIEHVFHTLHMHGLPADDIKLYSYLASDWQTGDLYLAMEEAYDGGMWDSAGYGGNAWKTDSDAFEVAAKEYLYLLNFSMFEYTDLWEGGSLSPEWDDSMRTQSGILANNPLGYTFHNTYISPAISKPSLATIRSIFQDGDLGDPTIAGSSGYVITPLSDYSTDNELEIVSSSFNQINDIIQNGTGSLPTSVTNVENNIKVTDIEQYTSLVSGSSVEISIVEERAGLIENIVQNGTSVIPTIIQNNTDISNLIKVGNVEQYVSASGADKIQSKILSSSFGLVIDGLTNGTGSLPTIADYSELVDAPKTVLAYNLIKENIEFIKEETILFMSSSWSTFVYDEEKCRRDVGLIVSGAAEDLIRNSNSASVVNTKFYYEYPSDATGSQLDQTTTAIKYAGNLVQNIVRNYEYTTVSAEVSASYDLLIANKEFIQNETIEFVSSSWSGFEYNELTCKRDVGYIIDAVATDLLYGGNERTITAGKYYYDYPSAAIVGGVPSVSQQKDPTVTAINYVKGLSTELVSGSVFVTSSNEIDFVYDSVKSNRGFIQNETIAFVNAKYPNLQYNEASCSRDTGFIVDAVITDLKYGGNQRTLTAGEFYYRFPSKATNVQLGETTDAVTYISDLVKEIVLQNTLPIPSLTENSQNLIKTTSATQITGSGTTDEYTLNAVSSSFGIVMDIVQSGTGSLPTISEYTQSLNDSEVSEAYSLLIDNIPFIQSETIAYISSSWGGFEYNEASCSRDVGLIVSGAAEDLLFGSVSASVVNGKFYYEYPSDATGSQLNQTLDGIRYASRLANNLIQSVTYVTSSIENVTSHNLLRDNKEFIQSESIAYISSSWSSFGYNEETCKRDVGYIIDAISTDILYGGNERSVTAGDFYYRYPSNATTSELEPTTTGIEYAGDLAEKIIVNELFATASAERLAGSKTLLENREFIQSESISYINSAWSNFEYSEASCSRDIGYIIDAAATDFLYGGNERSRTAGEFYYKFPSSATVAGTESPNVNAQLYPTIDGIRYASGISQKLVQNIEFVTSSNEVSSSWNLLRDNTEFIQNEVIAYVSSSWSGVFYNEDKCKRDVGYLIDAAATDLYYGGNERSINAGSFYYLFPSSATEKGVPSTTAQLDPTVDGIRYAGKLSTKVIKNETFVQPSASVLVGADLLVGNKELIQKETIAFLSSSWSEFEYNEASCSRDLGYIIDAVRTDLLYGGNERSVQAGTFYYYIPSVATTEQKPQTTDGIDFAKGLSEKVILKEQLVKAPFQTRESVDLLRASKKELQSIAISYTNGAFPGFEYNEEKCYRDTGFIVDAIATDLYYGGNERSIAAAESYYTGVYGDAAEVITNQQYETADVNRYLRTQFQRVVRNSPLEEFGSLIITTGHDFSYAGSGVTYKALPPNQGGAGIPDPDKEITEIAGGRVFFTSGNELGDFRIGTGLVINQATGTLQGRTFSRSLFSLVTPFSLALEG
jgi:hypothetical protein